MAMQSEQVLSFQSCFEVVEDPRVSGRCAHPMNSVLFLMVAAVISGADGPADIESFGKERRTWLERFIEFPAGIPSHDTIGRILALLKPRSLQDALLRWIGELRKSRGGEGPLVVPIDGKTARGSYTDEGKTNALHIVSAWATDHGLTLGQVAVDSKSNEITAIPELLKSMDLRETIITLDALGTQKSIAKQIVDGKGDYTLAVKGNHPKLLAGIEAEFAAAQEAGLVESGFRSLDVESRGHGREEIRHYIVGPISAELRALTKGWKGAKSIGQAINVTYRGGKETIEIRYYISSRPPKVSEFANSVRKHWGIESMHWVLDVVFGEDSSRIRTGHATDNMSFVRRFVTSLLKQDTSRSSLKAKRKRAGWNTDFLENILFG
jgi:predicted transposase YbfD/YdcC